MRLMSTIRSTIGKLAALLDSIGKVVENAHGVLPVDAGIRDADTVLEAGLALSGDLLVA